MSNGVEGKAMALIASMDTGLADDRLIVDSGATHHVVKDFRHFKGALEQIAPVHITFGNQYKVLVEFKGIAEVKVLDAAGKLHLLQLHDALYVPGAEENLLSISAASAKGVSCTFVDNKCVLKGASTVDIIMKQNLYMLSVVTMDKEVDAHANMAAVKESPDLWHRRLGHIGQTRLVKMVTEGMVTGIKDDVVKEIRQKGLEACDACIKGKHKRRPYKSSKTKTKAPLELVHMDLMGPFAEQSLGGGSYIGTWLDDYSGWAEIAILSEKSQVYGKTVHLLTRWETQTGKKVKVLRSDNGGEYVNADFEDNCKKKGIVHQTTVPYTPQQNGKAERLNYTLMDSARAILKARNLPDNLWAEAAVAACYLRNRAPAPDGWTTCYGGMWNEKPDVSHLRELGSVAYAHVSTEKRTNFTKKLSDRSEKGILVGYATTSKAYRILLDDMKTVRVARDVTVLETAPAPLGAMSSEAVGVALVEGDDGDEYADMPALGDDSDPDDENSDADSAASGDAAPPPHEAADEEAPAQSDAEELEEAEEPVAPAAPAQDEAKRWAETLGRKLGRNAGPKRWDEPLGRAADGRSKRVRAPPDRLKAGFFNVKARSAPAAEIVEPVTIKQAMATPEWPKWKKAMDEEMASLKAHGTWELAKPPRGTKIMPCRWVPKVKYAADGTVERFKMRLVAKGYMQVQGIDYDDAFAPVSKQTSLRALLSTVARDDLDLRQTDVKTAFLNGRLEEEVYMEQPEGYATGDSAVKCKLLKALYGLRQAPRAWHTRLQAELESQGLRVSAADAGLYTNKAGTLYVLAYVDDLLFAGQLSDIQKVIGALKKAFTITELGDATYFLGMEITRDRQNKTLTLSQRKYSRGVIEQFGLTEANSRQIPMAMNVKLLKEGDALDTSVHGYSEAVGALMYLACCTRPDLSQPVGALARYMAAPTKDHWDALKGVLRYLCGTVDYGITYGLGSGIVGYCDADFAGDIATRRSTTGYIFTMNGGSISWNSRLQPTVAASTTEAEYMAAAAASKEALWLKKLLPSLGIKLDTVMIYGDNHGDNQGALKLIKNPIESARSKHIDVIHHFVRERVARGEIVFSYIATKDMVADCLTKPVSATLLKKALASMGISV